jgi:hypothetical protein
MAVNSDGLVVRFGRDQGARGSRAAVTTDTTKVNELVLTVDLEGAARTIYTMDNDNDGTLDGFSGLDTPIPSGAKILDFDEITIETPAGGTNYTVGTFQIDGDAIDADGIRTTAGADGAQIGTQLAEDGFIGVVTTGTYTAGIVKIVIRYMIR